MGITYRPAERRLRPSFVWRVAWRQHSRQVRTGITERRIPHEHVWRRPLEREIQQVLWPHQGQQGLPTESYGRWPVTGRLRGFVMRVPKPKSRVVQSHNLSSLDGVKDVTIGKATPDDRRSGNFKKTGQVQTGDIEYDDEKARRERYGFPF